MTNPDDATPRANASAIPSPMARVTSGLMQGSSPLAGPSGGPMVGTTGATDPGTLYTASAGATISSDEPRGASTPRTLPHPLLQSQLSSSDIFEGSSAADGEPLNFYRFGHAAEVEVPKYPVAWASEAIIWRELTANPTRRHVLALRLNIFGYALGPVQTISLIVAVAVRIVNDAGLAGPQGIMFELVKLLGVF